MIGSELQHAEVRVFRRVDSRLTPRIRSALDELLNVREGRRHATLHWLHEYPPKPTPGEMLEYLERLEVVRALGVGESALDVCRCNLEMSGSPQVRNVRLLSG